MIAMERARNVAVLVYEKVDTLDVAGPYHVFGLAGRGGRGFRVYSVGESRQPLNTVTGITLVPKFDFDDCPVPDIVIVPGGPGVHTAINNEKLMTWISSKADSAELVISVCTGAFLLAKAELLEGVKVTTNRRALDQLLELIPASSQLVRNVRYVDNGKIVMSAGVTAGFDAALHVVARLHGRECALEAASILEYEWREEPEAANGQ
jgi:transcriptional regulator GlxA family with amidase domain